jgi:hypothetical protein
LTCGPIGHVTRVLVNTDLFFRGDPCVLRTLAKS